jgi:hypothetical protein
MNASVFSGVIRGQSIELEQPTGLPDGQRVKVMRASEPTGPNADLEETARRAFGAWAEDAAELDVFLSEIRCRTRKT